MNFWQGVFGLVAFAIVADIVVDGAVRIKEAGHYRKTRKDVEDLKKDVEDLKNKEAARA